MLSTQTIFTKPLLHWYDQYGRKNLPWQHPREPYRVWLSEIMLQQTQVVTVIAYFSRFIEHFPTINALAMASEDEVLALWSGLGYYSRARHLHKTAKIIHTQYHGVFPNDLQLLIQLPGIGLSTAAAITSQAFNQPTAILDGNVKRVLSRYFLIAGYQAETITTLWKLANQCMSKQRPADYTQAIMDFGALCCTAKNPKCISCPLQTSCLAKINNVIADYPSPKPKKNIPTKQQQFLLMHDPLHRIYLEKRSPHGLWGGLWCTPILEIETDPMDYVEKQYAVKVIQLKELMTIKHAFSHFKLNINVITIESEIDEKRCLELSGHWFFPDETENLGLPKPIRDMIERFSETSSQGIS